MKPHLVLHDYTRKQPVIEISCRHTLEHRIFNDRDSGDYQEMNPIIDGHMAVIQKVLCEYPSTKRTSESRKSSLSALHAHVAKLVASSQMPTAVSSRRDTTEWLLDNLTALIRRVKRR